jgi:hypothetical protein
VDRAALHALARHVTQPCVSVLDGPSLSARVLWARPLPSVTARLATMQAGTALLLKRDTAMQPGADTLPHTPLFYSSSPPGLALAPPLAANALATAAAADAKEEETEEENDVPGIVKRVRRDAWAVVATAAATVLGMKKGAVDPTDYYMALGGTSFAAMRLVADLPSLGTCLCVCVPVFLRVCLLLRVCVYRCFASIAACIRVVLPLRGSAAPVYLSLSLCVRMCVCVYVRVRIYVMGGSRHRRAAAAVRTPCTGGLPHKHGCSSTCAATQRCTQRDTGN